MGTLPFWSTKGGISTIHLIFSHAGGQAWASPPGSVFSARANGMAKNDNDLEKDKKNTHSYILKDEQKSE
jgi:hypothetical protein